MSRLDQVEDLLRAFSARDLDAIRALADAGFDLDAAGGGGLTVLMRAVLRGDTIAVEWILAAGADPDGRGDDGKTALDLARELGRQALVELLLAAGATDSAVADAHAGLAGDVETETLPAFQRPARAEKPAWPVVSRSSIFTDEIEDRFEGPFDDRFDDRLL